MVLRGTIGGSFSGVSSANVRPAIEWAATQNVSNNTSTITMHLVFYKSNAAWYPYNLNGHAVSMSIDGNNATSNRTFDLRSRSTEIVWTRTMVVKHNADGTKKMTLSASGNTGVMGSYSLSGSIDLNKIPRSSKMSISPTLLDFGQVVKFNIDKSDSSFSHIINYNINGSGGNAVAKTASSSPTWTIPLDLMKHCASSKTAKITIWLDTYSGNSKIGVVQYSLTANVPSSIKPSITSFLINEKNSKISKIGLTAGDFLQGNSNIECVGEASSKYGATISRYEIEVTGIAKVSNKTANFNLSSMTSQVGSKTVKMTVTDTRGMKDEITKSIKIQPYEPPKINEFKVSRKGTNILLNKSCTFSQVGVNKLTYEVNVSGGKTMTLDGITHQSNSYTFGGYDLDKSYELVMTISDELNTASVVVTVGTDRQLMHIDKDNGFGIGKYREDGILDIAGDVNIDGNFNLRNGFSSVHIQERTDLNDCKNVGFYHCPSGLEAQSIANSPTNHPFSLIVEKHTGIRQTLSVSNSRRYQTFSRDYADDKWSKWFTVDDYCEQEISSIGNNFESYGPGSTPMVYRYGRVIVISGAFKNTIDLPSSADAHFIAKLPDWAFPASTTTGVRSRNQGSGNRTFLLDVSITGNLTMARYGDSGTFKTCGAGSWITVDIAYMGRE